MGDWLLALVGIVVGVGLILAVLKLALWREARRGRGARGYRSSGADQDNNAQVWGGPPADAGV